ncbi:MAG: potassium transporter TrkG, partial [Candidatus Margulisiibacteriota bacterium]
DSLAIFSGQPVALGAFSILIFLGGIGFPVIFEIYHRFILNDRQRLKLQTKMALYVSLVLILLGVVVFYFQSLLGTTIPLNESLFHSISARTAGFSMGDISSYSLSALWLMLFLMIIGASPGSTGGGIKTTTFGVLFIALVNTIRGRDQIHVFDRNVKLAIVLKALAILTMSFTIIFVAFFILLITETIPFFPLLFETVSAFATVGFSMGITSDLSEPGKLIIIFLMLFGRIGPLTLAVALTKRPKAIHYKLPNETILLG